MLYRSLAESVLVLHLCFVVFAALGGLLVVRRHYIAWLHIPALIWSVLVEFFLLTCPLTKIENSLRQLGGEAGYAGGFIDYYISAVLYTEISPQHRLMLGLLLIGFNSIVYCYAFRQHLFSRRRIK